LSAELSKEDIRSLKDSSPPMMGGTMTLPAGASSNSLAGLSMGSSMLGGGMGSATLNSNARSLRLERVAQALAHSTEELRRYG